ncbi:type VI secretion system contractile sheath small subunit [Aeromonas hydrophila]|uniref:Type VI secretion system contractile sheath small subunit n=1 Tax=Aeromonas hydrophila TaxID=644 RepID=A0A926FLD2_AERHY|nr:type VI secretion system contractile sheath small subunit [Aeromonas hydrophila]
MKESALELKFSVPNRLEENSQDELPVSIKIQSLEDFTPDSVAQQCPSCASCWNCVRPWLP